MNLERARAAIRDGNADEALACLRPDQQIYALAYHFRTRLQDREGTAISHAIKAAVRRFSPYVTNIQTLEKQVAKPNGKVMKIVSTFRSKIADVPESST